MKKNNLLVVSIAPFNSDGLLLIGKRKKEQKWNFPGGKLNEGEPPTEGAKRELKEEIGLDGHWFEFLGVETVKNNITVYSFRCQIEGEPTGSQDPDGEMEEFRWLQPHELPKEIVENLYNKEDVTLQKLGLQEPTLKSENQCWRAKDGLKIPTQNNPQRLIWDEKYRDLITQTFVKNDENVLDCYVRIADVGGYNTANNKTRIELYKKMLASGEELPPVVLRYDEHGLSLLDGNHRQEAAKQIGTEYIKAVVVWDTTQLEKSVGGIAGLMATGLLFGGAMKPNNTVHSIEPNVGVKVWTPDNLPPELHHIAMLESSGGKNLAHKTHPAGEYHSAYGALGLKASTGHGVWKRSPKLQKEYPGLADPADFLKNFKTDPVFYNKLANNHFQTLKARHGDIGAVFAWKFGSGAASKASPELMEQDPYIIQYKAVSK